VDRARKPEVVADAAWHVLTGRRTGEFLLDETVLREAGVTDFSGYAVDPEQPLFDDLFV
jgi:citronellol/citronellal dehydrogenase